MVSEPVLGRSDSVKSLPTPSKPESVGESIALTNRSSDCAGGRLDSMGGIVLKSDIALYSVMIEVGFGCLYLNSHQ